jgi:hypothetical protein
VDVAEAKRDRSTSRRIAVEPLDLAVPKHGCSATVLLTNRWQRPAVAGVADGGAGRSGGPDRTIAATSR